ncbi:MAG: hypothetical protein Q4C71_03980 [Microbacteriaceae bacterium]|nr:hypothetical protein [Microbacteriaceae bacterium]
MARLDIFADRIVVKLSRIERLTGCLKGEIVVPRAQITSVVITEDPWLWIRGVRFGLNVQKWLSRGTWYHKRGRDIVLAKRGVDAVVIDIDQSIAASVPGQGQGLDERVRRLILSSGKAGEILRELVKDGNNLPGNSGK